MTFEQWWEREKWPTPDFSNYWANVAKDAARAAWDASRENQEEYQQLKDLTVTIWKMFYREDAPEFEPLGDILGLISQIDNMVTGLERSKE